MPRVRATNKESPLSKQVGQMGTAKEESANQSWSPSEVHAFHVNVQLIGPEFHELSRRIGSKSYNQVRYFFYRIIKKAKSDLQTRGIPVDVSNRAEIRYAIDYYFENLYSTKRCRKATGVNITTQSRLEPSGNKLPGAMQTPLAPCANLFRTTDHQSAQTIESTFISNQAFSKPLTPPLLDHEDIVYSTDVFGSSNNDIIDSSPSCPSWSSGTSPVASLDEALGHGGYSTLPITDAGSDSFLFGTSNFRMSTAEPLVEQQHTRQYEACGELGYPCPQDYNVTLANGAELNSSRQITLQLLPICDAVGDVMNAYGYNPKLQIKMRATKQISSVLKHLRSKWSRLFEDDTNMKDSIKLCFVQGEDTVSVFDSLTVDLLSRQLFNGEDVVVLGYVWDMSQCQIEYLRQIQDEAHCPTDDYALVSANENKSTAFNDASLNTNSALDPVPVTCFVDEPGFSLHSFPNTSFGAATEWSGFSPFFPN